MQQLSSPQQKACPVVLRRRCSALDILAFRHPLAGCQLVKGSIEADEEAGQAALRELREESGIREARIESFLGTMRVTEPDQEWQLFVCATDELPDAWTHQTDDDGGHSFEFFWHPVERALDDQWHPVFRQAVDFIRERLCR